MLVLDASFAVPLLISEVRSPKALSLVQRLRGEGHIFIAPTLWIYEVTSSIQKLRHFGTISTPEAEIAVESLSTFEIN